MRKEKDALHQDKIILMCVTLVCCLLLGFLLAFRYTGLFDWVVQRCYFHDITHLYCPGCGGTRAVYALLTFHPIQSFLSNPIVVYAAGLLLYYYIGAILTIVKKNGRRYCSLQPWMAVVAAVIVLAFFVVRNGLLIFCKIDYLGDLLKYWT